MHMHATPCDGTIQKVLIRKLPFVRQCRRRAGLTDIFARHDPILVAFFCILAVHV